METAQVEKFEQWFIKQRKRSGRQKGNKLSELTLNRYTSMLKKSPSVDVNEDELKTLKSLQNFINSKPPFYCFAIRTYLRMLEIEDIDNRIKINTIRRNLKAPPIGASVITNITEARKKRLSKQTIKQFIKVCTTDRDKVLILLLYDTACRISEVLNIKIDNIDFTNKSIFIEHGKGGGSRYVRFETSTAPILQKYVKQIHQEKLFTLSAVDAYLLIKKLGAEVYKINNDKKALKATPHYFRHSRLTHLAEVGWSAERLQSYAGWSDIRTSDVYVQMTKEAVIGYKTYTSTDLWED